MTTVQKWIQEQPQSVPESKSAASEFHIDNIYPTMIIKYLFRYQCHSGKSSTFYYFTHCFSKGTGSLCLFNLIDMGISDL